MIPKDRTVAALDEVWSSITELLVGLDDAQWSLPSPLPGWDVQDNVAHIVGTEAMLLGIENPDIEIDRDELPHVQNDIGVFNELWVQYLRMKQPNEVLSVFEEYTGARLAALAEMSTRRVERRVVHPGREGHLRPVHADPGLRLLAARAGHPRCGRDARPRVRARCRGDARRDGDRDGIRRGQARRCRRWPVGDVRAHRRRLGRAHVPRRRRRASRGGRSNRRSRQPR